MNDAQELAMQNTIDRLKSKVDELEWAVSGDGWVDAAYARLGVTRDKMTAEEVTAVQYFLDGRF